MYSPPHHSTRSPPPLQHPIPTHPPRQVPDPPGTPTPSAAVSGSADTHMSSVRSRAGGAAPTGQVSSTMSAGTSSSGSCTSGQAPYARYSSPPIQPQQPDTGSMAMGGGGGGMGYGQSFGSAMNDHSAYGQQQHQQSGYGNPQQSSYYSQQAGGAGQQQQSQFGGFANFLPSDPNVNMTAQMGMHFGQQMASVGGEYMQKNISTYLPSMATLRPFFNVSNSYVLHKLRVILFPWRHRPWSRAHRAAGGGGVAVGGVPPSGGAEAAGGTMEWQTQRRVIMEGYAPPREDVNAPDLYIPVMSFVTYVLLISVILGLSNKFRPEILGLTASRALIIIGVELLLIKLACYLLNVQGNHYGILDLTSYAGYKFVPACVTLAASALKLGGLVWWMSFVYSFAALAFFLLRSLRHIILPDAASAPSSSASVTTITHAQRNKRVQLLFIIAVLQFLLGAGLCLRVTG
ncbi:YIF1-domain-containing protein [Microstroma glucosiphilum]|uniref:YIF1-domain-containing protein n=1 Tax=Pseudomicrostroma glucosiphilum TaxID=1684307 RepID=A0A316TYM9_9BASI|nr:YIF1-domain-containing protein [Pseudomicrostroma glucosiphilum]PWN17828.1 YIF1-domain-containing protein [Pseudomicrostroma glucosiphilum]